MSFFIGMPSIFLGMIVMLVKQMFPETASDLAALFEALSDPTRIRIIAVLVEGEIGVGEPVERIVVTKSAISRQLRGLRDKRIVRTRKQERNVYVCIDDEHVVELFQRGLAHIVHR